MVLWDEIKKMKGLVLKTLDRGNQFEVLEVLNSGVIVVPFATKKERLIPQKEIEGAYQELISQGEITRNQIQSKYSPWNPVYVAAMLNKLPGIHHTIRPIVLYYKGIKK